MSVGGLKCQTVSLFCIKTIKKKTDNNDVVITKIQNDTLNIIILIIKK